jgi:hypothetical protein
MPFGRYKGQAIADLPDDYLEWLATIDLLPWLEDLVLAELDERHRREWARRREPGTAPRPAVDWDTVIRQWHREMVMRFHPDRGGSHEAMTALNVAYERLQELTHT